MEKKKTTKKTSKTTKKPTKTVVKKEIANKTVSKKKGNKKKKGFTLIELLAVIIILGILMIIAIPSVTSYISDSRKSAYVDTAKEIVSGTRNIVNEGKLGMYDTNTTYYIPAKYVNTENSLKSPYGEFTETSAYVGVIYDGKGYKYYWISSDDTGQGVPDITLADKLETDDIKSDLKIEDIRTTIENTGIGNRTTIKILKTNGTWESPIILSNTDNNVSEEGGSNDSGNNNASKTAAQQISEVEELVDVADAKRYVGSSPKNFVTFNNGESWRIIGVYGDQLKITRNSSIGNKYFYDRMVDGITWANGNLITYLNGTYYDSISDDSKAMIADGTWYYGRVTSYHNAYEIYDDAKASVLSNKKVGLIAFYEYMFATSDSSCYNNSPSWSGYVSSGCASKDWLNSEKWTINNCGERYMCTFYNGQINSTAIEYYQNTYPTVYLKSSVKITGGTGKFDDPYTLSL